MPGLATQRLQPSWPLELSTSMNPVYGPLALADIPALTSEIVELRSLYLTARGYLREFDGDELVPR